MKKFKIIKILLFIRLFALSILFLFNFSAKASSPIIEKSIIASNAPSQHAATIIEVEPNVFFAAWYAGQGDGKPDVKIWGSRLENNIWSEPKIIASSQEVYSQEEIACWNPVLCRCKIDEKGQKKFLLFYKIGNNPREWTGFFKTSTDGGLTWSNPNQLPAGIIGPAKNKPIVLEDGSIICGSSVESWKSWACYVDITRDEGLTWKKIGPIYDKKNYFGLIQPTIFLKTNGDLCMFIRSKNSKNGCLYTSVSSDNGQKWSEVKPTSIKSNDSGIDTVKLNDGRILLFYNNLPQGKRFKLSMAVSNNDGITWKNGCILDRSRDKKKQICYPSAILASNGLVHVVYTYDRKAIKHVIIDPNLIKKRKK